MSTLAELFEKRRTLKADFEARKKLEWEATSAALENAIDAEIRTRHPMKVADIQRAMGTLDWRTAKTRYERALAAPGPGPAPQPSHAAHTPNGLRAVFVRTVEWAGETSEDWTLTDGIRALVVNVSQAAQDLTVIEGENPEGWNYETWLHAEKEGAA